MTVPVHGLPLVLDDGMEVVPVPPALKGPRSLKVTAAGEGTTGQLVSFTGVSSIDAASALVGKTLLVRAKDLPKDFALHDVVGLSGREVVDAQEGMLGTIEEVMQGVANDVWVVRGPFGEVLVPVVDEFIERLEDEGPILVNVPAGLVERD